MITNDAGQVAIRRVPARPKYIKVGEREYVFGIRANIALIWADPEDVDKILAIRESCHCPNASAVAVYSVADEIHVRRWLNGGGR